MSGGQLELTTRELLALADGKRDFANEEQLHAYARSKGIEPTRRQSIEDRGGLIVIK